MTPTNEYREYDGELYQVASLPIRRTTASASGHHGHVTRFPKPCIMGEWNDGVTFASMSAKARDRYLAAVLKVWSKPGSGHVGLPVGALYALSRAQGEVFETGTLDGAATPDPAGRGAARRPVGLRTCSTPHTLED